MSTVIEVKGLTKKFGDLTAVNNIDLKLEQGKIYGFIGPNGAGKTTTMSLLVDLIKPTKGTALIKKHEVGTIEAKKLLGYAPEFPSFYTDMTCIDYMIYMGRLGGLEYDEAVKKSLELLKYMELEGHLYKKVSKFSTGMKKKVGLAQAMIHDPEILLLDEPTANLDPTSRMDLVKTLKQLVKEKNLTLIISSHVLTELELIISDVIMINKGEVIKTGTLNEVKESFNSNEIIIKTDDNAKIKKLLKTDDLIGDIIEKDDKLIITTSDSKKTKKKIIKIVSDNDILLDLLTEQNVSLDDVYRNLVLGGEK